MRGAVLRELHLWVGREPDPLLVTLDEDHEPVADLGETLMDALAPWGGGVVDAAISRLTPAQQQTATMRYVDDLQLGEIANVNGTSVAAVSQRLATIHRTVALALAA